MYCHSCGNKVEDGVKFCPVCGVPVKQTSQSAAAREPGKPPVDARTPKKGRGLKVAAILCAVAVIVAASGFGTHIGDLALSERTAVDVSALPDSLKAFLRQFHDGYWDAAGSWQNPDDKIFDSEHAADGSSNIMAGILSPEASCVDYTLYPGNWTDEVWGTADPRGWQSSYRACDRSAIDWIAKNIFNISDEDILTLVQQAEDLHVFYADSMDNGEPAYYVPLAGGVGGFFNEARLLSAETDGVRYYVTYEVYEAGPDGQPDGCYQKTYQAEVELKNIDGQDYWSLYRNAPAAQEEGENGASLDEWLGVWYADTGEYLDIQAVSDTGLSLMYHHIVEIGFMDTDYEMEFDDAAKTIASEIGDREAVVGWEYTLVLGDGTITVQSRYPDQTYIKSEDAASAPSGARQ